VECSIPTIMFLVADKVVHNKYKCLTHINFLKYERKMIEKYLNPPVRIDSVGKFFYDNPDFIYVHPIKLSRIVGV
jgi:hypothetical protein